MTEVQKEQQQPRQQGQKQAARKIDTAGEQVAVLEWSQSITL